MRGPGRGNHTGAHTVRVELGHGSHRRPARGRDAFAQHDGVVAGGGGERGRALDRGHREPQRDVPGEPEQHTRLGHRVDEVEGVRRAGPREGGDGVQVLLGHAHHQPGRGQQTFGQHEVVLVGGRARGDRRDPLADERGRVGHHPDHRRARREQPFVHGERHPGCDRHDERARCERGSQRTQHRGHDGGLDGEQHDPGARGELGHVSAGHDAVLGGQRGATGLVGLDHAHPVGCPPTGERTGEQRAAHHAAAHDDDRCQVLHAHVALPSAGRSDPAAA